MRHLILCVLFATFSGCGLDPDGTGPRWYADPNPVLIDTEKGLALQRMAEDLLGCHSRFSGAGWILVVDESPSVATAMESPVHGECGSCVMTVVRDAILESPGVKAWPSTMRIEIAKLENMEIAISKGTISWDDEEWTVSIPE